MAANEVANLGARFKPDVGSGGTVLAGYFSFFALPILRDLHLAFAPFTERECFACEANSTRRQLSFRLHRADRVSLATVSSYVP